MKATTLTSAPGSEPVTPESPAGRLSSRRCEGFTLIELMVVVAMIALASAVVSLALRDPSDTLLEKEGARLAALFESARAEARASGLAVHWLPISINADRPETGMASADFTFVGLPASAGLPRRWLTEGVTASVIGAPDVVLGPEPLIGAQRITLRLDDSRLTLSTDGLGPFVVSSDELPSGPR